MYYYCIENQQLVSVMEHEPNVPDTVTVVTVSRENHQKIQDRELWFDVIQKCVVPMPQQQLDQIQTDQQNQTNHLFLSNTDWKILRHLRQQALGLPTSLTETQYLELEQQRETAARSIISG